MKWNEMELNIIKSNQMEWNEIIKVKWNRMELNEPEWNGMDWNEMKWIEKKLNEMINWN